MPRDKSESFIRVRLRAILQGDFRTSEYTMFQTISQKLRNSLRGADAVCFVSKRGNQVCFVFGFLNVGTTKPADGSKGTKYGAITSVRIRLTRSTWNPLMLQNYAAHRGLELIGIKRFEEHYERLRKDGE